MSLIQVLATCDRVKPFAPGKSMARAEDKLKGDTTRFPIFPVFPISCLYKLLPNLLPALATNKEGGWLGSFFFPLVSISFVTGGHFSCFTCTYWIFIWKSKQDYLFHFCFLLIFFHQFLQAI